MALGPAATLTNTVRLEGKKGKGEMKREKKQMKKNRPPPSALRILITSVFTKRKKEKRRRGKKKEAVSGVDGSDQRRVHPLFPAEKKPGEKKKKRE